MVTCDCWPALSSWLWPRDVRVGVESAASVDGSCTAIQKLRGRGHTGDKWQFLKIRCTWLLLLKLQRGSIYYSWNALQSKHCSSISGSALSWETFKFSALFPHFTISFWKYPSLRWT